MPALPNIAGVVRIAVRGHTSYGTRFINVIHLKRLTGSPQPGDYAALQTALNQLYNGPAYAGGAGLLSNMNSSCGLDDYTFESLDSNIASSVLPATASGTGVVTALPPEVAMVISIRTATRGRRYRGRIYLPPPTTSNVTSAGNFVAAFSTQYPAQCVGFNTAIQALATPYKWVVASYGVSHLKNGVLSTWIPFATDATSWSVDSLPDVQRRRKS